MLRPNRANRSSPGIQVPTCQAFLLVDHVRYRGITSRIFVEYERYRAETIGLVLFRRHVKRNEPADHERHRGKTIRVDGHNIAARGSQTLALIKDC